MSTENSGKVVMFYLYRFLFKMLTDRTTLCLTENISKSSCSFVRGYECFRSLWYSKKVRNNSSDIGSLWLASSNHLTS